MKKFALILACIMLLLVFVVGATACSENKYTVTFSLNGGETTDETTLTTNKLKYKKLPEVEKTGYSFVGWCTDSALTNLLTEEHFPITISAATTYYAKWEVLDGWYTVSFDVDDGTTISAIFGNQPIDLTALETTKTGYALEGWYTTSTFDQGTKIETDTYTATATTTLYAKWETQQVTVTFETNGGSEISDVTKDYNSYFYSPVKPTKTGQVFIGWFEDEDLTTPYYFPTKVTQDVTVYAKWQSSAVLLEMEFIDGHYVVKGIGTDENPDIVIPSEYNGNPVTEIAENAFLNCTNVTSIVVPSSVTKIGKGAFANCSSLRSIQLPFVGETVDATGEKALFGYVFSQNQNHGAKTVSYYGNGVDDYAINYIPSTLVMVEITNATQIPQGAFYNCCNVKYLTINSGVTAIAKNAFAYASGLVMTNIPDSVITLGDRAYYSCIALYQLSINSTSKLTTLGKEVFAHCVAITNMTLPATVTTVPEKAFMNCYLLESNGLAGVTTVGEKAFANCYALTSFDFTKVTAIDTQAFSYCISFGSVSLPSTLRSWGEKVFEYSSITDITFANSTRLTSIPEGTFASCHSLTTVTFTGTNDFASIGDKAFYDCTSLKTVPMSTKIVSIGESAFEGCTAITLVDLSSYFVATLGDRAFAGCTAIITVTLPSTITTLPDEIFYGCTGATTINCTGVTSFGSGVFQGCTSLATFTLPAGVTDISNYTFYGCTSLSTFGLGTAVVTNIGNFAFYNCTALTSFTLPDTVTDIGEEAFRGCTGLKSFDISSTSILDEIGDKAFYGCTALNVIKVIPDTVTTVGDEAFYNCNKLRIFLEAASDSATLTGWYEGWDEFSTIDTTLVYYNMSTDKFAEVDDATYVFSQDGANNVATLISYSGTATSITIPSSVTFAAGTASVKTIGANAFYGLTAIKKVVIPEGVTSIEESALYGCTGLQSLYIPRSVTEIGASAFAGCSKLTKMYLGATSDADFTNWYSTWQTGTIEREVYYSVSLTATAGYDSVLVNQDNLEYIADSDGAVLVNYLGTATNATIPSTVGSYNVIAVNNYAFYNCTTLLSIFVNDNVATIKSDAFLGATAVVCVALPDSVQTLESGAFDSFDSMYVIIVGHAEDAIPSGWYETWKAIDTTMNRTVYYGHDSTEYALYNNVVYVKTLASGNFATAVCGVSSASTTVEANVNVGGISCEVKTVGDKAFYASGASTITISSGITSIGEYCFAEATDLENITLPSGITAISDYAFYNCSGLYDVIIPDSVTSIGDYAFSGANSLESLILPSAVETIGDYAFDGISTLTSIYYKGTKAEYETLTTGDGISENGNAALSATTLKVYYHVQNQADLPEEDGYSEVYWHYTNAAQTVVDIWRETDRPSD